MSCDCDHWMYCDHIRDEQWLNAADTARTELEKAWRAGYVAGWEDGTFYMYREDTRLQESDYA